MALPGKEKECVAIAKDALKQIEAKRYIAEHGVYLAVEEYEFPFSEVGSGELQPHVKKLKKCKVCAVGALFLSAVRKYNAFDAKELRGNKWLDSMKNKLREFFTRVEVSEMEEVFESNWGNRDETALKKVLRNVIRNKGNFKAPKS
jgi:hypothetical protein